MPSATVFLTGCAAMAVQCALVREYLCVFAGNELVLGMVLAVWLGSAGLGSMLGGRGRIRNAAAVVLLFCMTAAYSIIAVRFSRTLFPLGTALGPLAIAAVILLTETAPALAAGMVFGVMAQETGGDGRVYGAENWGSVAGALIVWICVMAGLSNMALIIIAITVAAPAMYRRPLFLAGAGAAILIVFGLNAESVQWKYAAKVSQVRYGAEGEMAFVVRGNDTTLLLNNMLYRTSLDKPMIEQAVHIPAGQRPEAKHALVVFDRGHEKELGKYQGLTVDIIETEPLLVSGRAKIIAPEQYTTDMRYDLVYLGCGMPENAASGRLYTVSFFRRMRALMSAGGILTFTLAFSENYLPPDERRLYDMIRTTLAAVFESVLVFPGNGYTFMASDGTLDRSFPLAVATDYLAPFVMPSTSPLRIEQANAAVSREEINTAQRPMALLLALRQWTRIFGTSVWFLGAGCILLLAMTIVMLPKTHAVLSVATSGLLAGIYSIALMMLFQSVYGTLYSEIALLLAALTAGFGLGSRIKLQMRNAKCEMQKTDSVESRPDEVKPAESRTLSQRIAMIAISDAGIGVYAAVTLIMLAVAPRPAMALFLAAHAGMGFLAGAQFVTRPAPRPGTLNTADLFGGMLGMCWAATFLIPLFGIVPVALGLGVLKAGVWISCGRKNAGRISLVLCRLKKE